MVYGIHDDSNSIKLASRQNLIKLNFYGQILKYNIDTLSHMVTTLFIIITKQ